VGFFPGSTIGNFEPLAAVAFLRNAARILGRGALLIIGVDLVKDPNVLRAAYNDAAGVTAAFNLNLLARMNRELGANFDLSAFEHRAYYNRPRERIEMHLKSKKRQKVSMNGATLEFERGETIHTENSYKYTPEGFASVARQGGWIERALWTDKNGYFSVRLLGLKRDI
jgi:dimethylhistidine N-methyltransferase